MLFKRGGIFVLPNGRELMASGDETIFYAIADNGEDVVRYELSDGGRILCQGRLTAWGVEDLRDTHRTADLASKERAA